MLIKSIAMPLWAPDEGGAGDGGDTGAVEKTAVAGAEAAGADKGQQQATADEGGDQGKGGKEAAGLGSNSGQTAEEALADLALSDEMKSKLVNALPKEVQDRGGKWLKTRSSWTDLLKAGLGADSKISELTASMKGLVRLPGKDSKPDEIAAFRKAAGVPETADKYAVFRPEKFEPTDADKEAEKTFLDAMHAAHAPQGVVDAAMKAHYLIQAQSQKAAQDRASAAAEAAIEDLRVEFGRDYKANITLADRWLQEHLGADMGEDWKGLMSMRFADGTALGEKPGFVKAIVKLAKAWADDGPVDMGSSGGEMDLDKEIDGMMGKMGTEEYKAAAFQQRLDGLIALRDKRKSRAA